MSDFHKRLEAEDLEHSGHIFLFRFIADTWSDTAKQVMSQVLPFYVLMLVGFILLYWTMRSTAKLQELRRSVAATIGEERKRRFDLDDYKSMPAAGWL